MSTRYYLVGGGGLGAVAYPESNAAAVKYGRPVAVIDPEDREAVERLWEAWRDNVLNYTLTQDNLQQALREFAASKPKPEPFKPGDVVRHRHTGSVWTIAADGRMVSHKDGCVHDMAPDWVADCVTAEYYERLTVTEDGAS